MPNITIRVDQATYERYCELRHLLKMPSKQDIARTALKKEMRRLERKLAKKNGERP